MMINASRGRYYNTHDSQYDKCRNCEQPGHFAKSCPLEPIIKCHYCMHTHKREHCELDYCFICAKSGHKASSCPHKHERTCRRCFKRGHYEADCTILVNFRAIEQRSHEHLKVKQEQIRCLNCNQTGHVQCYLKGTAVAAQILRDELYNHESMRLTAIEMDVTDLLEGEDMRPRVIMSKNQRRRKLNELMTEEVEDRTLEAFSNYSQHEFGGKSYLAKRQPDREHDYSRSRYNGRSHESYRGGGYQSRNKPSRGRGGRRHHF